jgi:hypothetical protein
MKTANVIGWVIGLAAVFTTVWVAGKAWKTATK